MYEAAHIPMTACRGRVALRVVFNRFIYFLDYEMIAIFFGG